MSKINITGASQRVQTNARGEWSACYMCNRCQDEFASVDNERSEAEARQESLTAFDVQMRRYCSVCGYKLTDKYDIPESEYIAVLNATIDKLEADIRRLKDRIKEMEAPE